MQHSLYKDRFLNLQSKIQMGKALLSPIDTTLFSTIIKKYDLNINSEKMNTTNENRTVIRHRHKRNKKRDNKDRITRACVQLLPQAVRDP